MLRRLPLLLVASSLLTLTACGGESPAAGTVTTTAAPRSGAGRTDAIPVPASAPAGAENVVRELYAEHAADRGPFFQTTDRKRVERYFEDSLAKLIWSDAVATDGEVGVLGADPLYDAQDVEAKNLIVHPAESLDGKTGVVVTFDSDNETRKITWLLERKAGSWKIADVDYGDRTLRQMYETSASSDEPTTGPPQ